ncbi:MAG TPA: HPF/RaiA family ribosome-associated protein [Candidatus Andersenbacteria bacterium]|nr:HPF/RaiA family ribosome-associated protein [Candidatus Andersenbacteria bacterium]
MKHSLRVEHIELSETDKEQLESKLGKLEKHLALPYVTDVTISHDTHHTHGNVVRCTIVIEQGKHLYRAERSAETVQNAIDESVSALQSELRSSHDRRKEHK